MRSRPYDDQAAQRFLPPAGSSFARALREREEILGVLGLFAGKWPNSLAIQPGGTTRPVDASEIRRAHGLLGEYVKFIEQQVIGCELDEWLALRSASDLDRWMGEGAHAASDMGIFVTLSLEHGLDEIGTWPARFISSGGWRGPTGETLMKPGFHDGEAREFDPAQIAEHVKHSWYDPHEGGLHPFDGETEPAPERAEAYSWAKAPRYAGQPAEAGPLARMVNDRDPLVDRPAEETRPFRLRARDRPASRDHAPSEADRRMARRGGSRRAVLSGDAAGDVGVGRRAGGSAARHPKCPMVRYIFHRKGWDRVPGCS